jgi:hypothetical protein
LIALPAIELSTLRGGVAKSDQGWGGNGEETIFAGGCAEFASAWA